MQEQQITHIHSEMIKGTPNNEQAVPIAFDSVNVNTFDKTPIAMIVNTNESEMGGGE